jgi:uncharacterized protein YjlB
VVNPKTRAADTVEVTREDGPGVTGTAIQGGVNHELKEGDVIVIPAGTPHWLSKINGSIVYLVIRNRPQQLISLQWAGSLPGRRSSGELVGNVPSVARFPICCVPVSFFV